jgi:hypothetical protein
MSNVAFLTGSGIKVGFREARLSPRTSNRVTKAIKQTTFAVVAGLVSLVPASQQNILCVLRG